MRRFTAAAVVAAGLMTVSLMAGPAMACGGNNCPQQRGIAAQFDGWQGALAGARGQHADSWTRTAGGAYQTDGKLTHWSLAESASSAASRHRGGKVGTATAESVSAQSLGFEHRGFGQPAQHKKHR